MSTNKFQKSYFDVLGLCCSSEIPLIEKLLKPLDGVKEVSVVVASRTVIVVHDNLVVSQLQIVNVLNKARLEANARVHGQTNYIQKWPSPYAIACGVFLALSFLKYVYDPFKWLAIVSVVIGILPIVLKGYAALRNFTLDTNILVLIAVMGSIALRDYWEAASIVFLFTIAQWLESRASHKATAVMSSLMNMVPQKAILAETGEEIDANDVTLNMILAVKPGENIPIDGIVVDGKCEVDEKTLTGESFPVSKQIDSTVFAGTINLNGYISVKTTALAEDCVVAKMAKLVEEAQNNKSQTQRFIDKCAMFYTPAIVVISICLAAIPAILKVDNQRHWFHLALVVLVSGCPCALILSTPVATFCALSRAATSGLLIKGGEYLETLSKIKIIGFDKTGTITRGEFVVTDFEVMVGGLSLNTLLYWVSSIESKSSHPMAAALIDYAQSLGIEPEPDNVEEFENYPGEGIYGKIDGEIIYIGNRRIASRAGSGAGPNLGGTAGEGKSIGYIYLGGDCAGIFSLTDTCRSGAKEAIVELKSMGIKTAMLTGDSNEAATIAQNQLDGALEMVHAELLPQDKANIIKDFQQEAPTAMVGDGLNDAPALATADIGISMGVSGSALATETGHIILMSNDIRKIPEVIKLAKQTRTKVVQNVFISILTKAAILGLAIGGYPLVWAAVLADVGTCLVVIFNSMLLLKGTEQGHCHNSSWRSCFRKRGCHSHGEHNNHKCHSHSEHDNHKCHSHSEHDNNKCHSHSEDNNHKCHSHREDNNHKCHSHSENNNHKCNSHGESNNHKCHSHGHDHSHSIEEQTRHCLSPCQDHKHFSKPSHMKSCKSSHSHEHNHYSSTSESKGSCQHIEVSEDVKHNHEGRSSSQKHIPCYDHAKSLIPVPTNGCCSHDNVLKAKKHSKVHDSTRSNGKHKHHCSNTCYDHVKNVKPIPTNGCCEHKDRIEEVEHMHDHILGHNGEHKHEENGHFPVENFEHCVEIGEECHSNHVSSTGNCHTIHNTENTHEENHDFHEEVAHCWKNDNERVQQLCDNSSKCSSLHEKEACGATKACSSKLEKRHVHDCCRSFREERCSRNSRFGGSVGGLSEIIVE